MGSSLCKTLYVSDLDGSLLNSDAELSNRTVSIINELINDGMAFTYATARSFNSSSVKTKRLNLSLPIISNNGTFIHEPKTCKPLFARMLDIPSLRRIEDIARAGLACPLVYAFLKDGERVSWVEGTETAGVNNYLHDRQGDERFRPVKEYSALFNGEVFGCTFIGDYKEMSALEEKFFGLEGGLALLQRDVYHTDEYWLEILNADASKGDAALRVKQMAGCERIISFGDNINDISLFEVSDECYAVDNAIDDLKKISNGIIDANDNDGIALWLLERKNKGLL